MLSSLLSAIADLGAFVVALFALVWSIASSRGNRARTEAAEELARKSAAAAEASATAAADSAEARRTNDIAERREQRELAASRARQVTWSAKNDREHHYVLRNTGNIAAEMVEVLYPAHFPVESRDVLAPHLPSGVDIEPGASVEFLIIAAAGFPAPQELVVTWLGLDGPSVAVEVDRPMRWAAF